MARASVELIVEAAKAINPLRKVEQHSKKVDQALKKNQKSARNVEAAFQRMGRNGIRSLRDLESNAARLGKRMGGLRGAAMKAAVAFIAFKSGQAAIGRIESVRRLQRLGGAYGEVAELQDAATKASKTFGLSQTEANKQFGQIYARLRPVGVTLKDIESTFVGFNTVARLSGASSVEASNAFTQLAQALGSGALRGDEFNSISEQVPGILTAISKETGVAQGSLRKYAAEGKITSDIVMNALKRIEKEGAGGLKDAMSGPAQAFVDFKNIADDALVALGEESIPAVIRLINQLSDAIKGLMPVIEAVGSFAATVLGGIADIIDRVRDPSKLQAEAQAHFDKGLGKRPIANLPADLKQTEAPFFKTVSAPVISPAPISLSTSGGKGSAAKERVDMSDAMLALQKERLELLLQEDKLGLAIKENQIELLRISEASYEPNQRIFQILQAINALDLEKKSIDQEQLDRYNALKEAIQGLGKSVAEDWIKEQDRLAAESGAKLKAMYQQIGDSITNGIVNGITAAVDGTKSLAEVASSTLKQIGGILLQFGVSSIMSGIPGLGGLFGRANGGPAKAGQPYMVGERGPELFVPGQSGGVMRNEDMRSLMGRSPASGGAASMNFSFETTSIGGTEYVSREQLESAMAVTRKQASNDGAKRGMSMTLDKMQNSPRTRTRIGLR